MHDASPDMRETFAAIDRALETKSTQRPDPASAPTDPIERLVGAMDRQTQALEARGIETRSARPAATVPARTTAPARPRAPVQKQAALIELRRTSEALSRPRGADPLLQEKQARINADMDAHDASELARLRRENADLRRKAARPPGQRAGAPTRSSADAAFAMYRKALDTYMRTGVEVYNGRHLKELQSAAIRLDAKAFGASVNAEGGYFVQPEDDTGPMERLLSDLSPMRQLATVRNISAASFKTRVNLGGSGARWVGETTASTSDNTSTFAELEYPAKTLIAEPEATQEALEDAATNVDELLSEEAQYEFSESESVAYIGGNGVNQPKGILGYDFVANASWTWGKVGYIATGADGAFASSGPADVVVRTPLELKAAYRQNASWLLNRTTIGQTRTLKATDGHYLWAEGDVSKMIPNTLAGYVVNEDEHMPSIASNAHAMAFGDWKRAYLIVDRLGFTVLRNPYLNPPYVRFHMRKRVGGGVKMFEAFKTIRFSAS
jgi:HK97 family phage major capsid protein